MGLYEKILEETSAPTNFHGYDEVHNRLLAELVNAVGRLATANDRYGAAMEEHNRLYKQWQERETPYREQRLKTEAALEENYRLGSASLRKLEKG